MQKKTTTSPCLPPFCSKACRKRQQTPSLGLIQQIISKKGPEQNLGKKITFWVRNFVQIAILFCLDSLLVLYPILRLVVPSCYKSILFSKKYSQRLFPQSILPISLSNRDLLMLTVLPPFPATFPVTTSKLQVSQDLV